MQKLKQMKKVQIWKGNNMTLFLLVAFFGVFGLIYFFQKLEERFE